MHAGPQFVLIFISNHQPGTSIYMDSSDTSVSRGLPLYSQLSMQST